MCCRLGYPYIVRVSKIKEESILIFFFCSVLTIGFILGICLAFYFPFGLRGEDRLSVWFSPFAGCWLHT